jgi:pimeloyl-ACP methyl ester carboxylesterase
MSQFAEKTFKVLAEGRFLTIRYREWGAADNPNVAVCVHGLSRNCQDFDDLAAALSAEWRVFAVDMPGRGGSNWLDDKSAYGYPLYEIVCAAMLARTGADEVAWIGTSMGGNLGMRLASRRGTPITKLVLNDIGPFTPAEGRRHNQANFGKDPRFESEAAGIDHIRETRSVFGPFSEEGWQKFGRDSLRQLPDGQWTLQYDPDLSRPSGVIEDTDNWALWPRIHCPVLTVWGLESKLLLAATVERMASTGPKSKIHEVPGVGHCPGLTTAGQIDAIRSFLAA